MCFSMSKVTRIMQKYYKKTYNIYIYNNLYSRGVHCINKGSCFNWAYLAYKMYGGELISEFAAGAHAFIKYKGKYYDSSTPRGVKNWRKLNTFKYWGSRGCKLTFMEKKEFIDYWKLHGGWDFIDIHKKIFGGQ